MERIGVGGDFVRYVLLTSAQDFLTYDCAPQDGTPIWGQRSIDGPGVWVTCVKGKEKQTVGELYDVFESVSGGSEPVAFLCKLTV